MTDPFKILKDLELSATGLDPDTMKQQEGYFVAFRDNGLAIQSGDFMNPWTPTTRATVPIPKTNTDPKNAPTSGTAQAGIDPTQMQIYKDELLAAIGKSQQAAVRTHMLVDPKPEMSNRWTVYPGSGSTFDTYMAIVSGANGIPGEVALSPELQQAYDHARAVLVDANGDQTPAYLRYEKFAKKYTDALTTYQQKFAVAANNPDLLAAWPMTGTTYRQAVDAAFDEWTALGSKETVESALATLAAQGMDPAMALISRAKKDLASNLFDFPGIGLLPETIISPSSWADETDDNGWLTYTSTEFHNELHYNESSTSIQASAGGQFGFWHASGDLTSDVDKTALQIETEDLEITFEYMIADVARPVFKTSLFDLQSWFLYGPSYPKGCVSTGKMGQQLPTDGTEHVFLPSLITGLVLVRNFSIKFKDCKTLFETATSRLDDDASVGYGPFVLKGKYGTQKHSIDVSTDDDEKGLSVKGILLVGYRMSIMPAAPAHDSSEFMQKPSPQPAPAPQPA